MKTEFLIVTMPMSQDLRCAAISLLFHSVSGKLEQLVATVLLLSSPLTLREDINIINNSNNNI